MPLNSKILSFICLCLLVSCSKETSFTPVLLPTTLFVRAQIDPSIGVDILVSKALSTGDTVTIKDLLVKDATISLIDEQKNSIVIPQSGNGKYYKDSTGLNILAGKKFQIKVEVASIKTVVSEWVEIPTFTNIDTINFALDGGKNGSSATGQGSFEFKDANNTNDYYLFRMKGIVGAYPPLNPNYYIKISNLCEIASNDGGDYCFDETCFGNSTAYYGKIYSDTDYYFPDIEESKKIKEMHIYFGKVNKSYYVFLNSLNQPENWENGLIEPKKSYSNIKGGFGIFYASNTIVKKIVL